MSELERADSQSTTTGHVGGGATNTDREAVAREIGTQLKEGREAQRLSLEDVSARLKVAPGKLVAIESGDISSLTDVTFAKGVMRAYARTLQIDIDSLLGRYHAQAQATPVTGITRRHEGALNQTFDDRKRFGSKGGAGGRWLWLVCVVALVGAGGYFGFDHAKAWLEARSKAAAEAPAVEKAVEEPAAPQSNGDGTVTAALPPVMAGNDSPAPSEATPDPALKAQPATTGAAAATSAAIPPATGGALSPAPETKTQSSATTTASAPAAPAGDGAVQIRFASDTWYEVRDRTGKVILGGTGKAGDTVAGGGAGGPYKVILGNVKGVESLTHNGSPVNLQAVNRNNVARLTLQ